MALINQVHKNKNESITLTSDKLAKFIDHTKLTFADTEDELQSIAKLCAEAQQYQFYAVCVRPYHVAQAKSLLLDSGIKVATVIGFPLQKVLLELEKQHPTIGHFDTAEKLAEIRVTLQAGADEFDVVMNITCFKQDIQKGTSNTLQELKSVQTATQGRPVKVIIETDLLSNDEILQATRWCAEAGVAMVKTSTGMIEGGQGATLKGVELILSIIEECAKPLQVKASGGIKNRSQALEFLNAGVHRLGTSAGIEIVSKM